METEIDVKLNPMTANHIRNITPRLANRCVRTSGITRRKWSREEEQLLLHLFQIYGYSWHKYGSHYENRSAVSIKNKYYALVRRGDAHNRATYGTKALSDERSETSEKVRQTRPLFPAAPAWHVSTSSISDLSTIEYKICLRHDELPASAYDHLTSEPASPSAGSEYHANLCFSATLPRTDCRDLISLDRPSLSEDGAATPPLLSSKESVALPDSEISMLHYDGDPQLLLQPNPLAPLCSAPVQVHYINHPAVMFTFPFSTFSYKSSQPITTCAPSILSPIQYYFQFMI